MGATQTTGHAQCSFCKEKANTYTCNGCSKAFCFDHLTDHRQAIGQQFELLENDRNVFRQELINQKESLDQQSLIDRINKWREDSILKIEQAADQYKQLVMNHTGIFIGKMKDDLSDLTEELRKARNEDQFNETYLNDMRVKLTKLQATLKQPSNVTIQEGSVALVNKLSIGFSPLSKNLQYKKWNENAITIAGGNGEGNHLNQLHNPHHIYLTEDDQVIYISDCRNHRIITYKHGETKGQVIAGGNGSGIRNDQLVRPLGVLLDKRDDSIIIADEGNRRVMRWSLQNETSGEIIISDVRSCGLAIDQNGDLYVSDEDKHEVRRWKRGEKNGTIVAGGNGQGNRLDQLDDPTSIFVDEDYSVYVADFHNHRVMRWLKNAREGVVVAGGNGQGSGLRQLSRPSGVIVDPFGQVYVADGENHRVMRWHKGATRGTVVVGGNGKGEKSNQLSFPAGLCFDHQGNLYVTDSCNHRIQKFEIDRN